MDNTDIVSVYLQGGFANRVFQVLAALQYSKEHNKQFIVYKTNIYANPHEKDTDIYIYKLFPDIANGTGLVRYQHILDYIKTPFTYTNIPYFDGNLLLKGYFQSEKYFPSNVPDISTTYYTNTYFIHIRAGDYLTNPYHYICLKQYYKRCIDLIRTKDPLSIFLVFSNDNTYAKKYMAEYDIQYTISDITIAYYTLIEMANCSGGICANSSFSWLGGYFQKGHRGIVCMPSKWINNNFPTTDLYPPWATVVDI